MEKKSTTILIVDDDANLASNLQDILEAEGYPVEVAQSGEIALDLCREKIFDLGLIDIKLPDIPGMELIGKIAVLLPSVEYIIMTGYASVETAIEAVERRDILAYVTKPLNMDHLLSLIRQVVERRRAELELEAKERYFRSLIHNMHEDIVVIDRNYRITDVNNTLMVTTGLRRDEVIGRQCFEVLHHYDAPCETHSGQCALKEVFRTGKSCNYQHQHRREDASATYVDILLSPLKDEEGMVTHVIEATRDISDLVKSQQALEASERRYRRLFEAAKDGILILNAESGRIEDINPSLLALLGYSKRAILGKQIWELGLFKEKLRSQDSFGELQEKGYVRYEDLPLETKDGRSVDVEFVSNAYMVDNERVIQCNIRDITERKRLEEKTARLALFPELNPNPVLELDAEGNIKYLNPATKRMFPDLEALGLNHPLLEGWEELIAELGEGGWLKTIIRDKNIGDSYYVTVVYPIASAQSMHLYVRDITARKKAEVELLRVSEVLHSIRNVNQLITREKDRGRLLKGACRSLIEGRGFLSAWIGVFDSAQELVLSGEAGIGEDLQVLLRCLEAGKLPGCILQALTQCQTVLIKDAGREVCDKCALPKHLGGHTVMCARLEHQGRIYGVVHASIAPGIDVGKEEIGLFQEVTQDIAFALHDMELDEKHRQAEAALEQSEARYRDFYDNAPVAYYSMSTDGFIIQANKETHLLLGYSEGELIYKHRSEIVSPECQAKSAAIFERFKSGTAIKDEEVVYLTKDGTKLYGLLSVTPIRDGSGRIIASRSVIEDITERKRTEASLLVSEQRYRLLVENVPSGVSIVQEGKITFANQQVEELTGYSLGELQSMNPFDVIHPEDRATVQDHNTWRMRGDPVPDTYSLRIIRKDGSVRWLDRQVVPVVWDGKPSSLVVDADTTERKQAEEAVRRAEQNFRNSLDDSPLGIRVVSADGKTLYANRALLDIYGYDDLEELNATPTKKRYASESYAQHKERQKKRERGEFVPDGYGIRITRKDGKSRYLEVFRKEVRWNGKTETQVLYEDITERKEMEDKLRQSEAKYASLVEKGNDGIVIIQDGLLKFANSRILKDTGFSMEELMDRPFLSFVAPADREMVSERYRKRLAGKGVPGNYEAKIIAKDGREVQTEISASVIKYEDQPADMAIIRDITERKRMEEQLIVTDRLASIGELAAGLAHELNNPLTGVIGFSEILMKRDLPEDAKEEVKIIYQEAQRTAEVVKNLLTFARKHAPLKQTVNINEVIEKVLQLRAYEQRVNNIQVVTNLATNLPEIMADYFQLQQVFLNIIINAEYFMTEAHSGGTLTIGTSKDGQIVRASFTDDGPGIAPQALGHIFDPFFTTKLVGKGTGLGLSICHGIVSEHGGKIYAENQPGKGATFTIELPVNGPSQP